MSCTKILFCLLVFSRVIACNANKANDIQKPEPKDLGRIIDSAQPITMDKFIGANGFIDDPVDKIKAVGFLREYHNWGWDEGNWEAGYQGYPNNQMAWAPSRPGWSFDDFYKKLSAEGIEVSPCIQGAVSWLNATNNFPSDDKPIDAPGLSTTDPNSYHKKAHHIYQFAARFGSTSVDIKKLTLSAEQPKASGLNIVHYIEDWNEQDKSWKGKNAEFSPEEYAAMVSASYDGHCNTLTGGNGTFGAKNADPNIKLAMGGLVELNLDYIKRMKAWFENNRKDKKFAADVINFHVYAWKDGNSWQGGGPALSPEAAKFKEKTAELVDYRNKNLPGKEVWISEFGWDTFSESPLCVPVIGNFDTQEVQGWWLIRAYLAFAAAGVDRAQMFALRDGNPTDPTWFSSSGMIGQKGDFTPKKSWYYIYTLKNILTNMRFLGEQKSTHPDILIYKFKDINSNKGVYAIWFKTSNNSSIENFELPINAANKTAAQVNMIAGNTGGEKHSLTIQNNKVFVNVSEKPIFIQVEQIN